MGLEERAAAAVVAGEKAARSRRRGKKASSGGADAIGDAPNALSQRHSLHLELRSLLVVFMSRRTVGGSGVWLRSFC